MNIQIDSREKARAITKIIDAFASNGVNYFISKLYVGDYMSLDNPRISIDRKQNLNELCCNVCQQHERFINEIVRANKQGIKLIFLCEHGNGINKIDDVFKWYNPRLRKNPKATKGVQLAKALYTIQKKYNVDFLFCDKRETGIKIIELLK